MAQVQQIILPYHRKCSSCGIQGLGVDSWGEVNPNLWGLFAILGGALAVGIVTIVYIERQHSPRLHRR